MKKGNRAATAYLLAGAALAAFSGPAFAQTEEQTATTDQGLGIIVVTAQRRFEGAQDVPIALTAFDEAAVERLNARDISELTGQVPNLVLNEVSIGPGLTQISIRGVNSQDPEKSFDPAVGVFIDGIYLGTSAFNLLDTFDLERLEVLRGPQGTLFGRNTTGGAINAFRRRPGDEFGVRAQAVIGSDERLDLHGEVTLPLGGIVSMMVRGQYLSDDGLFENPAGGSNGAEERWAIGGVLRFNDPGVADITLIYDHARDDSELTPYVPAGIATIDPLPYNLTQTTFPVPATVVPAFGPDLFCLIQGRCANFADPVTTITDPHFMEARLNALTLNADIPVGDELTVTTILGYRDSREEVFIDFDGTNETAFNVVREQDYEQYSGEIRIASDFEGPVNFVAGAFYFHSEYSLRQAIKLDLGLVGVPVPFGLLYINGNGDEDDHTSETTALFAEANWQIVDTLTLTLGARATWDNKSIRTRFYGSNLGPTAPYQITDGIPMGRPLLSSGAASEDWFEVTPRVMLTYEPNEDTLFYASFTRGYNAGGFSGRAGTVADVTTPFDPEFINAYEIGGKLDLLDRRLRINVAAFWNDYDDKQEEAIEPGPPPSFTSTTVRNVAAARIRGIELEVSALPVESLRIDASLGYLDADYTSYDTFVGSGQYVSTPPQPPGTLLTADLSGLALRRAPEFTGSIGATYTADIGFGTFTLNGQARYVDSQFAEFFNSARGLIDDVWTIDAAASLEFGGPDQDRYRITIFGENLTDEQYINSFTNSIVDFATVSRPLQFGVELAVQY